MNIIRKTDILSVHVCVCMDDSTWIVTFLLDTTL